LTQRRENGKERYSGDEETNESVMIDEGYVSPVSRHFARKLYPSSIIIHNHARRMDSLTNAYMHTGSGPELALEAMA